MAPSTAMRGWGHRSRPLLLVVLLSVGAACGGGGAGQVSDGGPTTAAGGSADTRGAADGQQGVIPSPLAALGGAANLGQGATAGAQPTPPPPLPSLATTRHPEAPPNTISLDALQRQGRTHVLR